MRSARNRELFALLPVALLLTAGFAAVFAQENSRLGNLSLIYGAYFLAVCLATHLYLRLRLPDADPYLFPLVALLTAVGLVMVYRIDANLARDQANWFVLGLVLFALTIQLLRDYDVLERYRYTIAAAGILLLLAPRLPGVGQQVNGAYLGVKVGPLAFQPAEFSKICIVVFLASYLRENREVLIVGARRVLGVTLPPLKHLGPLLVVWGASMFMLVFIRDLGSSLMFFAAFLALIYVATGRFSFVVIGMAMFLLGAWFFASTVPHVHERVDIWLHPYADPTESGYQILQSIFAQADGGLFGKGFAAGADHLPRHPQGAAAGGADRHDLLADRQRAGPVRRQRPDPHLPAGRRPRLQDRPARRRRLLEAAGDRADRGLLDPGLRDHRRRHPGDPADRRHPALRQLRRQLDRRQLRPRRAAAADLRPRPPRSRRSGRPGAGAGGRVNRQIVKLFGLVVVLFAVLIGFTSYWSVFDAKALKEKEANARPLLEQQQIRRGRILAADGTVIARSVRKGHGSGRRYERHYPEGALFGHPIGYSFVRQGDSEFEQFHNDELVGAESEFGSILDQLIGRTQEGDDIVTNLDTEAQRVALSDLEAAGFGAVVAIEPSTGAVKVMASNPPYDPNRVPYELKKLNLNLIETPLVNRATQGLSPPGSTFKVVTAAAGLESGTITPETTIDAPGTIVDEGHVLANDFDQDWGLSASTRR